MKIKLSLLAFLLFPSFIFSSSYVNSTGCYIGGGSLGTVGNIGRAPTNGGGWDSNPSCGVTFRGQMYGSGIVDASTSIGYVDYPINSAIFCNGNIVSAIPSSCPSCPSGKWDNATQVCIIPPLSAYNNNPDGCKTAGGVYFSDKVCRSTADAYSHLSSSSEFKRGAFIAINGFVWTAAGIVTGFPPGIGFGVHAMLLGAGMMAFSPDGKLNSSSDTAIAPSSDSTTADGRIKVTLLSDSQALTKSDPSTGKVDQVAIIPNAVIDDIIQKQRYLMGGDLYQPNVTAPSPSLKDVKETSYDYVNNTATTLTHSPISTPENPVTTSQTTPISVIQNPDGTVTTLPTNTTVAPTVSGSGGGSLVLTSTSGTGGTGSGTGTTSGTGLDCKNRSYSDSKSEHVRTL